LLPTSSRYQVIRRQDRRIDGKPRPAMTDGGTGQQLTGADLTKTAVASLPRS
jgi:hypothetical protein